MKEKKVLFFLLGLLILLVGVFFFQEMDKKKLKTAITTSPNSQSTLSFSPSSKSVLAGENFSLEAKINPGGGNQISGASLAIKFPIDGIECQTITGGTGLTVFTQGAISNTNGTASIEVGASPSSPITASTTLAVLTCKGTIAGNHSISFDETATSAYATGETGSVIVSTSPASVSVSGSTANPTMTSVTFSPTSISAGQTSLLSWAVSDADGVYATCKGSNGTAITGLDNIQVPTSTMTSFTTSPYEDLVAYGSSVTCTFNAYKGTTKSTESKSATLTLASSNTYSCTGTTPTNATLCSSDDTSLTADTAKTLVSTCTTATKCEYTCSSGYSYNSTTGTCVSTTLPTLEVSFIESETDTTELTTAVQNETKAVRYQLTGYNKDAYDWFFKFSLPITVDGSTITTETWSQMPDDDHSVDADLKAPFIFSTTTTGDFYVDIKIVNQGAGSAGTAIYSSQSNHVNITASELTTIVNGSCGSSNGQSYSSAPSSGLCTLGTAGTVSGSGPWTWTCSGSGGGTTASCSANKTTTSTSTTTYTYSPTTSVIPVTEYTYSYTSKVAPASGPVTNVILLLSVSAAITLGVWIAMKKIKG